MAQSFTSPAWPSAAAAPAVSALQRQQPCFALKFTAHLHNHARKLRCCGFCCLAKPLRCAESCCVMVRCTPCHHTHMLTLTYSTPSMVMVTLSFVMAVWWLMGMANSFKLCTYAMRSTCRNAKWKTHMHCFSAVMLLLPGACAQCTQMHTPVQAWTAHMLQDRQLHLQLQALDWSLAHPGTGTVCSPQG